MREYVLDRPPASAPKAPVPGPRPDRETHPFWCVRPVVGEPGRFLVLSRSRGGVEHLVDILAGRVGQCSCENYTFEKGKRIREEKPISTRSLCWHLKMVFGFIGWEVRTQLRETLSARGFRHDPDA